MKKHKTVLLAALLLGSFWARAQSGPLGAAKADSKMSGSPSAGQGMGGLYSPNLYDGSANINIPIYQYNAEGSDFGICLGYNTKGVKVSEIAGDAGLHFQINTPSIQRIMKDLPDEINLTDGDTLNYLPTNSFPPSKALWMYGAPQMDTICVNRFWAFKGKLATYSESTGSAADPLVYRDGEADDFVVTLGSGTFTFNLGKNGTVFTHPHRNVAVEVLWDGQPMGAISDNQVIGKGSPNMLGFRIRDEQGNTYTFTRSDYQSTDIYDQHSLGNQLTNYHHTSRWVVSKVTLANGGLIQYTYQPLNYTLYVYPPVKSFSNQEGWYSGDCVDTSILNGDFYTTKLQYIQYPNGIQATFNYDTDKRPDYPYGALREIRVGDASQCLSYILKQSFFNSVTGEDDKTYAEGIALTSYNTHSRKLRLRLDAIVLNSCDNTTEEPYYSFSYNTAKLPLRLSHQLDYFGYYKSGIGTPLASGGCGYGGIPYHDRWVYLDSTVTHAWGFDKTPDAQDMKVGILAAVRNAYGGTAEFYYGGHSGMTNVLSGLPTDTLYFGKYADDGLRVDSIVESERLTPYSKKVTVFEYSNGQRFLPGGYFHYPSRLSGTDTTASKMLSRMMTSDFLTPHQLINGSNHGYSNVNVITRTENGTLLGRKEIKFSNFQDDGGAVKYLKTGSGLDFFTYPYTDKQYLMDWAMGLPLEVTEYDQNNRIVQKTINKYTFTLDTTSAIGKVDNQKVGLIPVNAMRIPGVSKGIGNKPVRDFYHPYTGAALLDTTIVRKYIADNAFVADTVRYHYDGRHNMDIVWARNSKGQTIRTNQAYNYTLNSPLGSPTQLMTQAGLEKMVGTERWILGTGGSTTDKLVDAFFNTYDYTNGKLSPKYLYNLQTGSPLTYAQYTGYTGGPNIPEPFAQVSTAFAGSNIPYFVKTSEVTLSDNRRNPLETRLLGQDLYKAMIWDTVSGQKIAEANCRYSDIAYAGFEATVKGNWEYNAAGVNVVNSNNALAGGKMYLSNYGAVTRSGLTAGKSYTIAFWSGTYGGAPSCTIGGITVPLTAKATKGDWTYYEGRFTASSSTAVLSVSAPSGNYMDEIRLFPTDAAMQCWSYKGMFGVSAVTAPNGRVSCYEYDKMGRQAIVRDQDGNILGKTEHHVEQ